MNRFTRPVRLLIAVLLSLVLLPVGAFAAQVATETVTIQVNVTTPDGASVIGTVVVHRQATTPVTSTVSFTGMVNGVPTRAEATATEEWTSDSEARIVITNLKTLSGASSTHLVSYSKTTAQAASLPSELTVNVLQLGPNLISVNGIPVAIDGLLARPFSGRTTYSATMPGQGSTQIAALPRTGDGGLGLNPVLLMGLLIGSGLALVGLSRRWRKIDASIVAKH